MKKGLETFLKEKILVINRKNISGATVCLFLLILGFLASAFSTENLKAQMVMKEIHSVGIVDDIDVSGLMEAAENRTKFENLKEALNTFVTSQSGVWSVYVKDLSLDESISINNQPLYAASLTKLFVMEYAYENMEQLKANGHSDDKIQSTLNAMITVSDNDAYNNLVGMQSPSNGFIDGCLMVDEYLKANYKDTGIYHTLHPCRSPWIRTATTRNQTSVEDCGLILEKIYDGTCVSKEASEEMLNLLLQQQRTAKIPAGLPEGTKSANKTGETDNVQHDAAIIFGPETDYILCVMSSGAPGAIFTIQDISAMVYEYLE